MYSCTSFPPARAGAEFEVRHADLTVRRALVAEQARECPWCGETRLPGTAASRSDRRPGRAAGSLRCPSRRRRRGASISSTWPDIGVRSSTVSRLSAIDGRNTRTDASRPACRRTVPVRRRSRRSRLRRSRIQRAAAGVAARAPPHASTPSRASSRAPSQLAAPPRRDYRLLRTALIDGLPRVRAGARATGERPS